MEENFNIHLGKKLRMRRLSLGLTQTKVAQAINVTFQQIQKYEAGKNSTPHLKLKKICEYLSVSIDYFTKPMDDANLELTKRGKINNVYHFNNRHVAR